MRSVFHLTCLVVIACSKEYLNQTKVRWEVAKRSCSVPQLGMLFPSNDYDENNGFYAWTSTQQLFSDWAFFYGCIDIQIPKQNEHRLSTYFSNSERMFITAKYDIFECAIHCTNMNYFVYYITTCLCISNIGTYPVTDTTGCLSPCRTDSVFCSSGFGVPLFKYKSDVKVSRRSMFYYSYHCVATKNGYNYDDNCYSTFHGFNCNAYGSGNIGLQTTWIDAVNNCTNLKLKLPNAAINSSTGLWLRYFRYQILNQTTNKARRNCIAIFVKNNQDNDYIQWSHYQDRNCSELLPFICLGDHKITSIALVPSSTVKENSSSQFSSRFEETDKPDDMLLAKIILLTSSIGVVISMLSEDQAITNTEKLLTVKKYLKL